MGLSHALFNYLRGNFVLLLIVSWGENGFCDGMLDLFYHGDDVHIDFVELFFGNFFYVCLIMRCILVSS